MGALDSPNLFDKPESCEMLQLYYQIPQRYPYFVFIVLAPEVYFEFEREHDPDDDSDEGDKRDFVYFDAADTRAAEIFLESGVMNPLIGLSNIVVADLEYHDYCGDRHDMKVEHEDMILDLGVDIEYCSSLGVGDDTPSSNAEEE